MFFNLFALIFGVMLLVAIFVPWLRPSSGGATRINAVSCIGFAIVFLDCFVLGVVSDDLRAITFSWLLMQSVSPASLLPGYGK